MVKHTQTIRRLTKALFSPAPEVIKNDGVDGNCTLKKCNYINHCGIFNFSRVLGLFFSDYLDLFVFLTFFYIPSEGIIRFHK